MTLSKPRLLACVVAAVGTLALTTSIAPSALSATPAGRTGTTELTLRSACGSAPAGQARCFAEYVVGGATADADGKVKPRAVTPADIKKAYNLPTGGGAGKTVAIVDAYDNPNAESDLATFRSRYGLPACTTANGCFRKVNQKGKASPLPQGDVGWGLEIALDLDAVSAACPSCKILLVEANSPTFANLGAGVNTAVRLGATTVSNSYGGTESSGFTSIFNKYYNHPGVPILASTGDDGYESPPQAPAVAKTVIAVGGTTMTPSAGAPRGFTEKAWSGAGSGCSGVVAKPSWQHDNACGGRTIADVSADADPASGLLVQDTYGYSGQVQVGGTSLSSPLVAAMTAMTNTSGINDASYSYAHASSFNDIVSGSNGSCGGTYLCQAGNGYDGPTGLGTPNGVAGLGPAS